MNVSSTESGTRTPDPYRSFAKSCIRFAFWTFSQAVLTGTFEAVQATYAGISSNYRAAPMKSDGLLPSLLRNIVEKAPGLS